MGGGGTEQVPTIRVQTPTTKKYQPPSITRLWGCEIINSALMGEVLGKGAHMCHVPQQRARRCLAWESSDHRAGRRTGNSEQKGKEPLEVWYLKGSTCCACVAIAVGIPSDAWSGVNAWSARHNVQHHVHTRAWGKARCTAQVAAVQQTYMSACKALDGTVYTINAA